MIYLVFESVFVVEVGGWGLVIVFYVFCKVMFEMMVVIVDSGVYCILVS